jgi:hypothetical protein
VRLLLGGEITVHGNSEHSVPPILKGPFQGQLIGTIVTERGNREAIVSIGIDKSGLKLDLGPAAALRYPLLGEGAATSGGFRLTNAAPVTFGSTASQGSLVLASLQAKVRVSGARPLGSAEKPAEVTSTAALKGVVELATPGVRWQAADFRLQPGSLPVAFDSPAFRIEGARAVFKGGEVHAEEGRLTTVLEEVAVARPSVSLRNGDTTPIDAVGQALAGRMAATFQPGEAPQFALSGPSRIELKPDRERIVDLVNDYQRVPNRYVPTGNATVPLASSYALRHLHEALREEQVATSGRHQILLTVNDSGAVADTYSTVEESDKGKYLCVTLAWTAKAVIDRAAIVEVAQSLMPLGLAAGLAVGAVTVPTLTPFIMAGVVGAGAIGTWAALEYWGGALEEATGLPGAPTFTPGAIARSLLEQGFVNACQVAVQSLAGAARAPRRPSEMATLSPRSPGETGASVRARREAEIGAGEPGWPAIPEAEKRALAEKLQCCSYQDFHRGYLRDAQIWREYAENRAKQTTAEIRQADDSRVSAWVDQQRSNSSKSGNAEFAAEQIRAAAEAQLREAIGGGGPSMEYSPGTGWSIPGGGGSGGGSGGRTGSGEGNCGSCACALNCMSLEVRKP